VLSARTFQVDKVCQAMVLAEFQEGTGGGEIQGSLQLRLLRRFGRDDGCGFVKET
jgi:hypothetical protein